MTLNQIAERIAYEKKDPFNVMLKENIKFSVRYWRAMLIRRDIAANGSSPEYYQKVDMPLQKVDLNDACNFDLDACKQILRTVSEIPQNVRVKSDVPYKFVGTPYGRPFTYTEYEEIPLTCYNRYTSGTPRYNRTNNYIYVFNINKLKNLRIEDIFVDPYKINTLCGTVCFNDSSEFPCPADLVYAIITGIVTGELKVVTPVSEEVELNDDKTIRNEGRN